MGGTEVVDTGVQGSLLPVDFRSSKSWLDPFRRPLVYAELLPGSPPR